MNTFKLRSWFLFLTVFVFASTLKAQTNEVRMTTDKSVGEYFNLFITTAQGKDFTVSGVADEIKDLGDGWKQYKTTSAEIIVSGDITALSAIGERITNIEIDGCANLSKLDIRQNSLSSLNLSNNKSLKELYCQENQINTLDVSNCKNLNTLDCSTNFTMTKVDVSGCESLSLFYCYSNLLTSIDVSGLHNLKTFACSINQLTSVDISDCPALESLTITDNQLAGAAMQNIIDALPDRNGLEAGVAGVLSSEFSEFNAITDEQVKQANKKNWTMKKHNGMEWEDIIVKTNPAIVFTTEVPVGETISMYIETTDDGELFIEGGTIEKSKNYNYTVRLTDQTVKVSGDVTRLKCPECEITSISAGDMPYLQHITCYGNKITTVDLHDLPSLYWFDCEDNQLESLDVSNLTALTSLFCNNNKLHSINIDNTPVLRSVSCAGNLLDEEDMLNMAIALPDRNNEKEVGLFYAVDGNKDDANVFNKVAAGIAMGKNWQGFRQEGSEWVRYRGSKSEDGVVLYLSEYPGSQIELIVDGEDIEVFGVEDVTTLKGGERHVLTTKGKTIVLRGGLTGVSTEGFGIDEIDAEGNTSLESIQAIDNMVTKVNLDGCSAMMVVELTGNNLQTLKLNNLESLAFLICNNDKMRELYVNNAPMLESIDCSENVLCILDIKDCPMLNRLECCDNQIRYDFMSDMVQSLPVVADGSGMLLVYDASTDEQHERNLFNTDDCAAATGRGWSPLQYKNDDWAPYEGSEVRPVPTITLEVGDDSYGSVILGMLPIGEVKFYGVEDPEAYRGEIARIYTLKDKTVTIRGDLTSFDCSNNFLTALKVDDSEYLSSLSCYSNDISEIEVNNCNALNYVACYSNNIDVKNMTRFVESLPDLSETEKGGMIDIFCDYQDERNVCTTDHVAKLIEKKWLPYEIVDGNYLQYNGVEDHTSIMDIEKASFGVTVDAQTGDILVSGLMAGTKLYVYDISGMLVFNAYVTETGNVVVPAACATSDVLILKNQTNVVKLSKYVR